MLGTPTARIVAVQDDLVEIEALDGPDGAPHPLVMNEVIFILPTRPGPGGRQERLKAEILRIDGRRAKAQVYESTQGVAAGDPVEQSGELLSVELGPGLLGAVYDGLQAPLKTLANEFGIFLPRGAEVAALNPEAKWSFDPAVTRGESLRAGDVLVPPRGVCAGGQEAHDRRAGLGALAGLGDPAADLAPVRRVHPACAGPRLGEPIIRGREERPALGVLGQRADIQRELELAMELAEHIVRRGPQVGRGTEVNRVSRCLAATLG